MSWQDRQYESTGQGGGVRAWLRRVFGDGENPFRWAVPLYRVWGISVKLHVFFIVYLLLEMIRSIAQSQAGWKFTAIWLGCLFGLVLVHEYGHCFACRRVRGEADEIILWPLGGLAMCRPPHTWQAHLVTVLGGPGVNLVLWPVLGIAVLLAAGEWAWHYLLFNPFDFGAAFNLVLTHGGRVSWPLVVLWLLYAINAILFLFNMLVPMYPMDAGRVLHALIWRKSGEYEATKIATTVGLVAAGVLAVLGIVGNETLFLALAVFGGLTCYSERRQNEFMRSAGSEIPGYDFSRGYAGMPDVEDRKGPSKREQKRQERERAEQEELDRLLGKIAENGMQSLSRRERKWLDRMSAKKRK